jgi:hypothetical protein
MLLLSASRFLSVLSLTRMFYSDMETVQAASLHVSFGIRQLFALDF